MTGDMFAALADAVIPLIVGSYCIALQIWIKNPAPRSVGQTLKSKFGAALLPFGVVMVLLGLIALSRGVR
jgi:hypothetical protein